MPLTNDPYTPLSASPPFQVVTTPRGVRVLLPPRQLGKLRWIGLISPALLLFGLTFMIAKIDLLRQFLQPFFQGSSPLFHWTIVAIVALACATAIVKSFPAIRLFLLGFGILFSSRCEIYLDDQTIRNIEHAGPFACTMVRRKRDSVQELRVAGAGIDSSSDAPTAATRYYSLQLLPSSDSKKKDFAPAYPRDVLIALAEDLQKRLALAPADDVLRARTASAPPQVDIVPVQEFASPDATRRISSEPLRAQPSQSRVQLLQENSLTTLVIPAVGFKGGPRAILIFGIMMTAFIMVFLSLSAGVMILHEHQVFVALPFIAVGLLFLGAGVAMLLGACQLARRHGVLIATPDSLTFTQTGPLHKFERQFPRSAIAALCADKSGTTINDHRLLQLQIRLTDGSTTGLLTGRDDDELRWLAFVLRQALQVPAVPRPVAPAGAAGETE